MCPIVVPIPIQIPAYDVPDMHTKKPYIRKHSTVDGFQVWVVDGEYIRKYLDTEFNNFGSHSGFPSMIPANELWLDREHAPDESKYYVRHLLTLEAGIKRGLSYSEARKIASGREAVMRARDKVPNGIYIKKLEEFSNDGCDVYLVNGQQIRNWFHIDFVSGGHDKVYPSFIPAGEIWIDNDIVPTGRKFVYDHELYERNRMEKGKLTYLQAHKEAAQVEQALRFSDDKVPHWGKTKPKVDWMKIEPRRKKRVRKPDGIPAAIIIANGG